MHGKEGDYSFPRDGQGEVIHRFFVPGAGTDGQQYRAVDAGCGQLREHPRKRAVGIAFGVVIHSAERSRRKCVGIAMCVKIYYHYRIRLT